MWEQLRNDAIHRTAANLRAANKGNSVVKKLGSFLLSHIAKSIQRKNSISLSFSFPLHWISKICERVMAQIRHHNPHSSRLKHSQSIHLLILHFDLRLRMQPRAQATSLSSSPILLIAPLQRHATLRLAPLHKQPEINVALATLRQRLRGRRHRVVLRVLHDHLHSIPPL